MGLQNLSIRQFRCFTAADLELSPRLNIIEGKNASGKTSILEAIFLLSRGRSFRTGHLNTAMRENSSEFLLSGRVAGHPSPIDISLARKDGFLKAEVAGKATDTVSQLASVFPVQLLDGQANQLIHGGPKYRRQFLDWGAFHVEPSFYDTWRRYSRTLKHRNAFLKTRRPKSEISIWDVELAKYGERLDEIRQRYFRDIQLRVIECAEQSLQGSTLSLRYRRGWQEDVSLADALRLTAKRDSALEATHSGPHRADVDILVNGKAAQETISRGQEKVLAAAFLLAQAALYQEQTGLSCTLLVDDLAAELDAEHMVKLVQSIREVGAQVIMTTIERISLLPDSDRAMFHVEQGKCHAMV